MATSRDARPTVRNAMSDIDRLVIEDGYGNTHTMYIEVTEPLDIPDAPTPGDADDEESYGLTDDVKAKLTDIHSTLQGYAEYAIGAFKTVGGANVEEMTLKFGIKVSGSTGLPVLTQGAAEGNFQIEVKCRFND
ncbi:MAG: CU044_2847 family protein [Elainellaceae cyanobacterium]